VKYRFISEHRDKYPASVMSGVLGVSPKSF